MDEFKAQVDKKLCELVDVLIQQYNPCKIEGSKCIVGEVPCCQIPYFDPSKPCPYINNSCLEHKTLTCRMWFCKTALKGMDEKCRDSLYALEKIAKIHGLLEGPNLGEGYVGDKEY